MAECTQPVKPVRSEGDFCLMGQGYIMSYCAVASPRADKKDCIYIYQATRNLSAEYKKLKEAVKSNTV